MEILLEEFYKRDLHVEKFHDRKVSLKMQKGDNNYQINGITQSGKTKLVKNYLISFKKNSYIYIDCNDIRIDIKKLNSSLSRFCIDNKIDIVAFDNYTPDINLVNVKQLIITSVTHYDSSIFQTIELYPLDYEEFLAYEHKYDSSALNHFFKLGGFAVMHTIYSDERNLFLQRTLKYALSDIEFDILCLCAKMNSQKLSAYTIYERLKGIRKISKDKLYKSFENLIDTNYLHILEKLNHPKATKKVYLCDTSLKSALSIDKNFAKLFENMIFLELLKSNKEVYYDDNIDFYLPKTEEIIICIAFSDERALFKKLEQIEAFLFSYQIKKVTAITMSKESSISHPLSKVEMIPFDIWAIGD